MPGPLGGCHLANQHTTINQNRAWTMKSELGRMRGCGKKCGGTPRCRFCRQIKLTKNKSEGDGAMAVGGHHKTGGHNNQLKVSVSHERDIGEGA